MKYLSYEGLAHLKLLIKNALNLKVDKEDGKGLSSNDYTTEEKTKLNGIEEGATKTIIDSSLSSTSTNPVENQVINNALSNKVDKVSGKGLSENDYTTEEKTKLSGIEEGANKTIVEESLNSTSTNPVQNKTIYAALESKVDKEPGKGLSENDLTDELLTKLNNTAAKVDEIATVGGEPNIIEVIKRNGTILSIKDKTVDITVPTNNNELTNGAGYITGIDKTDVTDALGYTPYNSTNPDGYQTESQVTTLITNAIENIQGITYSVVTALPTTGEAGVIYLISNNGSNPNIYDEYIYVNGNFEKIGTTDIDLSGYVQTTDLEAITNTEIDTIWES